MERLKKFQGLMEELGFTSFILTSPANIFYFTGFMCSGYLITSLDGDSKLYVYPIDYEAAQTYCIQGIEIIKMKITSSISDIVSALPNTLKKKIGFDELEVEQYLKVKDHVESLDPYPELVWRLRSIKDQEEISRITKAAEITSKCMELASEIISEGVRESEVKAEILEEMIESGADKPAFDIIVASGQKTSLPHGGAGDRTIMNGDIVIVDIGSSYQGYCADMTRTFYIGSNPPDDLSSMYAFILDTKNLVEENTKSWILASSLDEVARTMISSRGYGEYFVHGLGHGIGIEVHEPPKINPVSQEILQENNVITIEPGIYIPKKFGIRIEDTLIVGKDSILKLTSHPYEFAIY
ncbi:MAG: Xaa-Pro peptidase family protein [Thaumarchaeota archaeon]|jgi:Xaa-Pro aminopeptidase|nr:Xaa-Pro peptidase family protein [Candidatus Geocrenenecus arthurdayi]MCL7391700.1 Xaa-Pro peptidase family protein [Candidatus Geocrenenecus arthurdayi]MCL7401386.1 Xaa-Pro peptidase family protein [Candidatus Geocrenenecus arthurdayi]MCL7404101.1 Xaa-Pro peptidase family protein [Candidatus Geocrenenecus arthurdayi]